MERKVVPVYSASVVIRGACKKAKETTIPSHEMVIDDWNEHETFGVAKLITIRIKSESPVVTEGLNVALWR